MPSNLLSKLNKNKVTKPTNPNDLILPATPVLPIFKVKVPWTNDPIDMKILSFYHSKPHIFGCQFSNLFYSPFEANMRWIVPTKDNTLQTLFTAEISNINNDDDDNKNAYGELFRVFNSSEHVFQAAKAENIVDALFVQSLSAGNAARAGQGRLKMNNKLANKYIKFGGNPYKISHNKWQFSENKKRYKIRNKWHKYKIEIMNYALRLKFNKYYHLISEYVDSLIPIYFIEHTVNDDHWGDGNNGNGTNYLGKLLTTLCKEYRIAKNNNNINNRNNLKCTINTLDIQFRNWLNIKNIDVIQNGNDLYKDLSKVINK